MEFRIADTFTDSLAKLTGEEQKSVKTTAFDLQMNPVNPGMSLHKLDKAKDKCFWSVRVGSDIRLIVHKDDDLRVAEVLGHGLVEGVLHVSRKAPFARVWLAVYDQG